MIIREVDLRGREIIGCPGLIFETDATYLMLLLSLLMSKASLEHEIALGSKGISIQQTINGEISKYWRNLGPFFYLPGTIKLFSLYFLFLPLCGKVKESYPKVNKFFPLLHPTGPIL